MVATPVSRRWLLFALVGAGYALGSELAFSWFGADGTNASFFPAAGVTLAALVLVPRRQWPIVLLAAGTAELGVDLYHGLDLVPTLGYVVANVAQPVVGATLLLAVVGAVDLQRTRDLVAFIACAAIAGPAVGAALGASTYVVIDGGQGWFRFVSEWLVGDGLGVLVIGSAILSLRTPGGGELTPLRALEGLVLAGVCLASTAAVFRLDWFGVVYLPIALLGVIAFRFGTRGVALTGAAVAIAAAESTAEGHTFWDTLVIEPDIGLLYLQLALGVIITCGLALAAEIAQRERSASALAMSEAQRLAATERAELYDAEREARLRAELLERNAAHLATAVTMKEVAGSTVRDLQTAGIPASSVHVVRGDVVEMLAVTGVSEEAVDAYPKLRLDGADTPLSDAVGSNTVVELASAAESDARYPAFAETRRAEGVETALAVPLRGGRGRVLGALAVTSPEPGWLDERRRKLVFAIADQTGPALERAELQADADAASAEAAFLGSLGEALEQVTRVEERAERLVAALVERGRAFVAVHVLDEDGGPKIVAGAGAWPAEGGSEDELERLVGSVTRTGLPARSASLLALPLRARGRILGSLTIGDPPTNEPRSDTRHLSDIAMRAAISIDNALLYERERDVSHALQLGLLAVEPETEGRTHVAAAYRPGTATLEVGGDWYDYFPLPNGRLALVVGDVVGHALDAALAMTQLRGAVRALAPLGAPTDLLERLDRFVETFPDAAMATLAYVELAEDTGDVLYACAGHPPPLVVSADGSTRFLWEGRSAPLGSPLGGARNHAEDRIELHDQLLLYTDGLVERRTESLAVGLERLGEVARAGAHASPWDLVERLLERMLAASPHDDDVCLLVLRPAAVGRQFARSFPASREDVRSFRLALMAWLERLAVDEDVRRDVALAVTEAAANAAEHAYGFDRARVVRVDADLDHDGELHAVVRDDGTWRDPVPESDRGRGMRIMRALMDEVAIEPGAQGTVVSMRTRTTSRVAT